MIPSYAHGAASTEYAVFIDGDVFTVGVTWPGVVCPWGGTCHELVNVNGAHLGYCGSCGAMIPDATPETLERTHHGRAILAEITKGLPEGQYRFRVTLRSEFTDLVIKSETVIACGFMYASYSVRKITGQYVSDCQLARA